MGKYDDAMYAYLSDNERFADLFNGAVFCGKKVLRADALESDAERYVAEEPEPDTGNIPKSQSRFRDLKKRVKDGAGFAVIAIENQASVDYSMPWRIMQYDQLEYGRQIREIRKRRTGELLKKGKQLGNWSIKLNKADKLRPVYTICFYHGTEPWDGPRSLGEMIDFGENEEVRQALFHDYRMTLVCVEDFEDFSVFDTDLKVLLQTLAMRRNKEEMCRLFEQEPFANISMETARTIAIMTDSTEILDKLEKYEKEGGVNMCQAMDELKQDWKAEGIKEGIRALITACHELNVSYESVMEKVKEKYCLSDDETRKYMDLFW